MTLNPRGNAAMRGVVRNNIGDVGIGEQVTNPAFGLTGQCQPRIK